MKYLSVNTKVFGKEWEVRFMLSSRYDRKYTAGDLGETQGWKKLIVISVGKYELRETIIHELTHAHFYEMGLSSTNNLDKDDMEEIACEFISKHGLATITEACGIEYKYNKLKKKVKNAKT